MIEGIELTLKSLLDVVRKYGIRRSSATSTCRSTRKCIRR